MYKNETVIYHLPVNPNTDENGEFQSVTVEILEITSSSYGRAALMRKFLKWKFGLSRKESNLVMREMGFNDLIPCAN